MNNIFLRSGLKIWLPDIVANNELLYSFLHQDKQLLMHVVSNEFISNSTNNSPVQNSLKNAVKKRIDNNNHAIGI